jgi:hypothetical protein
MLSIVRATRADSRSVPRGTSAPTAATRASSLPGEVLGWDAQRVAQRREPIEPGHRAPGLPPRHVRRRRAKPLGELPLGQVSRDARLPDRGPHPPRVAHALHICNGRTGTEAYCSRRENPLCHVRWHAGLRACWESFDPQPSWLEHSSCAASPGRRPCIQGGPSTGASARRRHRHLRECRVHLHLRERRAGRDLGLRPDRDARSRGVPRLRRRPGRHGSLLRERHERHAPRAGRPDADPPPVARRSRVGCCNVLDAGPASSSSSA